MQKESSPVELEKLSYASVELLTRKLQGEILTVIEAAVTNFDQQTAFKSIVKNSFSRTLSSFHDMAINPPLEDKSKEVIK